MKTKPPIGSKRGSERHSRSLKRGVTPHAPTASEDAKRKIVDLWLSGEKNEARLILEAFKIGFDDGCRVRGNKQICD